MIYVLNKENFKFISIIRLPDFITKQDFEWAIQEATKKKKQDFSATVGLVEREISSLDQITAQFYW